MFNNSFYTNFKIIIESWLLSVIFIFFKTFFATEIAIYSFWLMILLHIKTSSYINLTVYF